MLENKPVPDFQCIMVKQSQTCTRSEKQQFKFYIKQQLRAQTPSGKKGQKSPH